MELIDALHQVIQESQQAAQLCDLVIGTVTSVSPLEISINGMTAPIRQSILYLTEPVVEKKIPILTHSHDVSNTAHSHTVSGLGHSHSVSVTVESQTETLTGSGEASSSLGGTYGTSTALNQSLNTDSELSDIICYEHGKALPIENGYIILNRKLEVGDKVLMLRVQHGQKFIIISRVFEVI